MTELPVLSRTEFGYSRTVCDCPQCSINCRFVPGYLIPSDLDRIAKRVGAGCLVDFAMSYLLASPGAILGSPDGQTKRIRTLVPARKADSACLFLNKQQHCSIHEVSPFGCAFFDVHQTREESDTRSLEGLWAIDREWQAMNDYAVIWLYLDHHGKVAPNPVQQRERMKKAMGLI